MTDDQIINIAWETFPISDKKRNENFIALLVHFARKIEAVEREECAKLCDESEYPDGFDLANLIRARKQ